MSSLVEISCSYKLLYIQNWIIIHKQKRNEKNISNNQRGKNLTKIELWRVKNSNNWKWMRIKIREKRNK